MSDHKGDDKLAVLEARVAELEQLLKGKAVPASTTRGQSLVSLAGAAFNEHVQRAGRSMKLAHMSTRHKRFGLLAIALGALTFTAVAYAYEPQYTFTAGTTIRAVQVNRNFADLFDAANEVAGQIAAVDARTAGISSDQGNIGIGIASPDGRLHVAGVPSGGGMLFDADNAMGTAGQNMSLKFRSNGGAGVANLAAVVESSANIGWAFETRGGNTVSEKLRIAGNGNVGIGTTDPTDKLQVAGDVQLSGGLREILFSDPGNYDFSIVHNYGTSLDFRSPEFGDGVTAMSISNSGNVGIGTASPNAKLHVDTGTVGEAAILLANHEFGAILGLTSVYPGSHNWAIQGGRVQGVTPGSLAFWSNTNGVGRMVITPAGNVGIGTTAPGYKLHVEGSAYNTTGEWAIVSDSRLKTDVKPIQGALETVTNLEGVTFHWKDPKEDDEQGLQRGFIAQDVEQVIPEWVKTGPNGYKYLEKVGAEALLVEAVKELKAELDAQREEIDVLRARCELGNQ